MRDINKEAINITTNLSRSSFFMKWYLDRGLRLVDYQQDILSNKIEFKGEPIVLAVAPGGGKTLMSIAAIEKYLIDNPNHKVLVLTHGQTLLRSQYAHNIEKHKPKFSWAMVTKELKSDSIIPLMKSKDIKTTDKQVIICLPHNIINIDVPHFDLVVVDEAHQFYFANMVQTILKRVSPNHQLLLTGTPSPFVAKKYKNIISVSLEMLLRNGMVSDPIIEIAGSTYDFKLSDYNLNNYELKDEVVIKEENTNSTLNLVLHEICSRLKVDSNWNIALRTLSKTMLVCKKQEQAKDVEKFFKNEGIGTALSISDTDSKSIEIERFMNNEECFVLIVVRKGILGFDFPPLVNVIDISCSQNIDRIFQLLCRVVRKSPNNEQKLFYKICPIDLVEHFKYVMTAVLCLAKNEYFLKFNGKNFLDLPIIVSKKKDFNDNTANNNTNTIRKRQNGGSFKPLEFSGLPAINFFTNCEHELTNNILSPYAFTTLRDVLGCKQIWRTLSEHETLDFCKSNFINNSCETLWDYKKIDRNGYRILKSKNWLDEFCISLGIVRKNIKQIRLTKKERFKEIYKIYVENNCESIAELARINPAGASYLTINNNAKEFRQLYNIKPKLRRLCDMSKEEVFKTFYKTFKDNNCKRMHDFKKIDNAGCGFLYENNLMEEFTTKFGIKKSRRWVDFTENQNFEYIYSKYKANSCNNLDELFRIDTSTQSYLYKNNLTDKFRAQYNIWKQKGK